MRLADLARVNVLLRRQQAFPVRGSAGACARARGALFEDEGAADEEPYASSTWHWRTEVGVNAPDPTASMTPMILLWGHERVGPHGTVVNAQEGRVDRLPAQDGDGADCLLGLLCYA